MGSPVCVDVWNMTSPVVYSTMISYTWVRIEGKYKTEEHKSAMLILGNYTDTDNNSIVIQSIHNFKHKFFILELWL